MKIINKNLFGLNTFIGIPPGIISNSVECFFELQGKPEYKVHRLIPKGTSEILFNLGEPFYANPAIHASNNMHRINCKNYLVSGIKTAYLDSFAVNYFHCVGIRFKINGMKRFFNISPLELADKDFVLDQIISRKTVHDIYERLFNCKAAPERFHILNNWLLKKMMRSEYHNNSLPVINAILSKPFLPVKLLEQETGFSRQYLHKRFKAETGISIKKYQGIIRVARVLSFIRNNPKGLTEAAYSNGYFDQSHFIRDFKNITGLVPTAYIAAASPPTLDPYLF